MAFHFPKVTARHTHTHTLQLYTGFFFSRSSSSAFDAESLYMQKGIWEIDGERSHPPEIRTQNIEIWRKKKRGRRGTRRANSHLFFPLFIQSASPLLPPFVLSISLQGNVSGGICFYTASLLSSRAILQIPDTNGP